MKLRLKLALASCVLLAVSNRIYMSPLTSRNDYDVITSEYTQIPISESSNDYDPALNTVTNLYTTEADLDARTLINASTYSNISTWPTIAPINSATKAESPIDLIGSITLPLVFVVGITGNSFSLRIMFHEKFRHKSSSLILRALAVSDTTLLCMLPFNKRFVRVLLGTDIRSLTDVGCKMFFWTWRNAKMTSSWLVVFISVERFIAVFLPLKVKIACSRRNTLIGISIIYLFMAIFNGVWSINTGLMDGNCIPQMPIPEQKTFASIFLLTGTMVYSIIPSIILLTLTPLIIARLIRNGRNRKQLTHGFKAGSDESLKTTRMLLPIVIAFVVLVVPISIGHNISFFTDQDLFMSRDQTIVFYREIAQLLEQLNYSINFFLYVLYSKAFRECFLRIICYSKKTTHGNSNTNSGSGNNEMESSELSSHQGNRD